MKSGLPEPIGRLSILTTQFSQFSLSDALMARLNANQFKIPTPVQAGAIPPALEGRDVLATAQTGTGKTLSFLIPIMEMLQKTEGRDAQALIVLPTRELAMQVEKSFRAIRSSQAQTVALVVGGMSEQAQLETIRRGARLIVATPGRLEDFLKRNLVRLASVKMLVLDEVDRMLDMGFEPAIRRIASTSPGSARRCATRPRWKARSRKWLAQLSPESCSHRDRLDHEAGRERRTASLQRGSRQEAGAS
jgi:ATP-dependent RNA helicase RhlE